MADKGRQEIINCITKELADRGKIVEAGWIALKMATIPEDAPPVQLEEMRNAFFAGAQHLFGSIMTMLSSGAEPTDTDVRRMSLINAELESFIAQYKHNKGLSNHGSQA